MNRPWRLGIGFAAAFCTLVSLTVIDWGHLGVHGAQLVGFLGGMLTVYGAKWLRVWSDYRNARLAAEAYLRAIPAHILEANVNRVVAVDLASGDYHIADSPAEAVAAMRVGNSLQRERQSGPAYKLYVGRIGMRGVLPLYRSRS
jgi:hypothetical protein